MEIKVNSIGKTTTVYLSGRIDKLGSEKLQNTLDQIVTKQSQDIVLDFKGVNFIGSSGIGKLLIFGREFTSRSNKVKIVNLNSEIKALFASTELDKIFNI